MKIVCDACSAKYSIADDKVKGKVFKIRCKKCSNIIVVRGTAGAGGAEEPAAPQFDQKDTRVYDYGYDEGGGAGPAAGAPAGDDAVWHLVIDQEQVGPLTVAEVQQRFQAGEIDAESYVWREGFADWQPLSAVDAFAGVVSGGGGAAAAASGSSGRDAVASMFGAAAGDEQGTVRSDPGDLFGAPAGNDGGGDDAGDLFGARAAASSGGAAAATAAEPRARRDSGGASGGKLRGERNENSVLFSLGNLAALASDAPRASASPSSSSSSSSASSGAAQHGGGEGSGLIDIRSMASAYLGPSGAAKKPAATVGSIDDLPVFTSSSFAEPAVIMPTSAPRQNNKTMVILIAAVGFLAVITLILVLVVVLGGKSSSSSPSANNGPGSQVATTAGKGSGEVKSGAELAAGNGSGSDKGSNTTAETGSGSGSTAAETGSGSGSTAAETGSGSGSSKSGSDKGSRSGSDKGDKHGSDKGDKHGSDKGSGDKGGSDKGGSDKGGGDDSGGGKCPDEVGCLLAEHPPACCSKYSKGKKGGGDKGGGDKGGGDKGGGGGDDLPETLDSGMIKSGVGKVKNKIFGCGDKYPNAKGTVKLSVKVSPAGKVTDASAVQTPDAGLGSCAASEVKKASFDKTQRGGSFKYPFNF